MKSSIYQIIIFPLLISVILSSWKISSLSTTINFYPETSKTRESFLQNIPIGTSVADAKIILKKNKLKFEIYKNSDFHSENKNISNADFLYVDKIKSKFWVSERWQVAIVYENEKITDILVSYGLIGM